MKIKVNKNEKRFDEVNFGQVFRHTFLNTDKYYIKCGFNCKSYGVDLSTGETIDLSPTDYVTVFPNATVILEETENENGMDKTR